MARTPCLLTLALLLPACAPIGVHGLRLTQGAVVTGDFDDLNDLARDVLASRSQWPEFYEYDGTINGPLLGAPQTSRPERQLEDLFRGDPAFVQSIDLLFLTDGARGFGLREYNGAARDDHLVRDPTALSALEAAVYDGLQILVSDWTYDLTEAIWPQLVDWVGDDDLLDDAQRGVPTTVLAEVVDPQLAAHLEVAPGDQIELILDFDQWAVPAQVGAGAEVLLQADVAFDDPLTGERVAIAAAPLLFRHRLGRGAVVHLLWHDTAQVDDRAHAAARWAMASLP